MNAHIASRATWLKGSAWLMSGSVVSAALSALSFVLIARLLGPTDLGRYSLIVAAVLFAITITTFRLEMHLLVGLRDAPHTERTQHEFETCLRAGLLLTVPIVFLVLIGVALFPVLGLPWWVVALAAVEILLAPWLFAKSILLARGKQAALAFIEVTGRVSWLLWIAVLYLLDQPFLSAIIVGRIISVCVEVVLLAVATKVSLLPHRPRNLADEMAALKASSPLAVAGAVGMTYNRIDQFLIAGLVGSTAVGFYASSVRLAELVRRVPGIAQKVITPTLVALNKPEDRPQLRRALRDGAGLIVVPVGLLIAVIVGSPESLIDFTLGSEFSAAATPLAILALAELPVAVSAVAAQTALALGSRRVLALGNLLGLGVNVVGNLILIPRIGIAGAAYSSLLAYTVVSFCFLFTRSVRSVGVGGVLSVVGRTCVCIAIAALVGSTFHNLAIALSATAATYIGIAALGFPVDTRRVIKLVKSRRIRNKT